MTTRDTPIMQLEDVRLMLPGPSGPVNVLRGVDLRVAAGEAVAVTGPSGSGKTTLLMVVAALERATSGLVRVDGLDLSALDEDSLARFRRDRLGVVFQGFHLIPSLTALENVALPLELARRPDARRRAMACLDAVGLTDRARHYPAQLSGGEQQRVAVARAFAPAPALLLADEPTGNLDADTGRGVMDLLFALRAEHGATLLLITHEQPLAARCGRVLRMADGRLSPADGRGV